MFRLIESKRPPSCTILLEIFRPFIIWKRKGMDKRFESAIVAKDQEVWNANVEEHSPHRQLLSHEEQGIGPESRGEATSVLLITDTRRAL